MDWIQFLLEPFLLLVTLQVGVVSDYDLLAIDSISGTMHIKDAEFKNVMLYYFCFTFRVAKFLLSTKSNQCLYRLNGRWEWLYFIFFSMFVCCYWFMGVRLKIPYVLTCFSRRVSNFCFGWWVTRLIVLPLFQIICEFLFLNF